MEKLKVGFTIFALIILCGACSKKKSKVDVLEDNIAINEPVAETPKYVDPEPEIHQIIDKITMPESIVYFDLNKSILKDNALDVLADLAQFLISNPSVSLRVNGYTCPRGTYDYNMSLSQARADAVVKYLVDYGVNSENLIAVAYGEEQRFLVAINPEEYSANRRVEYQKQ